MVILYQTWFKSLHALIHLVNIEGISECWMKEINLSDCFIKCSHEIYSDLFWTIKSEFHIFCSFLSIFPYLIRLNIFSLIFIFCSLGNTWQYIVIFLVVPTWHMGDGVYCHLIGRVHVYSQISSDVSQTKNYSTPNVSMSKSEKLYLGF